MRRIQTKLDKTRAVGTKMEAEVRSVLRAYSERVYSNVRVETMHTSLGYTEIDLLAAVQDVLLVVEVKNVSKIDGSPLRAYWTMTGANAQGEYNTLNVLTQNRIHVRSLQDAWYVKRGEFPRVVSLVVVPNGCEIPDDIRGTGVIEVGELRQQLTTMSSNGAGHGSYAYALEYLLGLEGGNLLRPDLGLRGFGVNV